MIQTVTGITLQKDKTQNKINGPCKCGSCSAFTSRASCADDEFLVDYVSCCGGFCTSQPSCRPVSKKDCDVGLSSQGKDPLTSVLKVDGSSDKIRCTYDLTKIDRPEQVEQYFKKFGKSDAVAENYCMRPTENNFSRASEDKWCSRWLDKTAFRNLAVNNYCKKYKDSKDCRCINRAIDPTYQKLKILKNFSDGCWYVPCSSDPSQLKTTELIDPTCPNSYCQSVVQVLEANDVSVKDVYSKINCKFDVENPPSKKINLKKEVKKLKPVVTASKIKLYKPYKQTSVYGLILILFLMVYVLREILF